MSGESRKILLISGFLEKRQIYARFLRQEQKYSYEIFEAENAKNGLELCQKAQLDLIVLDYSIPDRNGLEFLAQIKFESAAIPVLIIIDRENEQIGIEAIKKGAQDYLIQERLTPAGLCRAVANGIERALLLRTIQQTQERLRLVSTIALRVRQSLNLEEILSVTVTEVRKLLGCDRAVAYQLQPDFRRKIVAESVASGWQSLIETQTNDLCVQQYANETYRQYQTQAIANIYEAGLTKYYVRLLESYQVKAKLVVPIVLKQEESLIANCQSPSDRSLWGFLGVHQCSNFREWQPAELQLLDELGVQIAIAIQQATLFQQLKTKNAQLQASEERFRNLVETTSDWVWEVDENAIYTYASPQVFDILGYTPEEILGKTPFDLMPSPEDERVASLFAPIVAKRQPFKCLENINWHKNGCFVVLETSGTPIFDEEGRFRGYRGIDRDITERKQTEALQQKHLDKLVEWQNRYEAADRASDQIIYEWDSKVNHLTWGSNTAQILGYSEAELPKTLEDWTTIIHPEDRQHFLKERDRSQKTKTPLQAEYRMLCRDGIYIWMEDRNQLFADARGEFVRLVGFLRDISDRKLAESQILQLNQHLQQKAKELEIANQQLESAKTFIDNAIDAVSDPLFIKDFNHRWLLLNDSFCQLTGFSRETLLGKSDRDLFPTEKADIWCQQDKLVLKTGEINEYEEYFTDAQGKRHFLSTKKTRFLDPDGTPFIVGTIRDLTERKETEEALRRSEAKFQRIANNAPGAIYQFVLHPDASSEFLYMSHRCRELFEVEPEAILQDSLRVYNTIHPEEIDSFKRSIARSAKNLTIWHWEGRFIVPSGQLKWMQAIGQPERRANEDIVWDGFIIDISDRKQAEQQLLEELHLSALRLDISNALTQGRNSQDSLQTCTQAFVKHLDAALARIWLLNSEKNMLELQASAGMYSHHLNDIHSRIKVGEYQVGKIAQSRRGIFIEDERIRDREWAKREGMVAFAGYPMAIEDKLVGVIAMFARHPLSDRTIQEIEAIANFIALGIERQRQEEALRQSEERYRQIVETSREGIWVIDKQAKTSYCNPQMTAMLGYTVEEMQGRSLYEFMDISARQAAEENFQRRQQGIEETHDFCFTRKDGSQLWAMLSAAPLFDDRGQFQGALGMVTDISDRKQAEEQLRESEERFRLLADTAPVLIWMSDSNATCSFFNKPWLDFTGNTLEEQLDNGWTKAVHPEDLPDCLETYLSAFKERRHCRMEYRLRRADGEYRWILDTGVPRYTPSSEFAGYIGSCIDITDRKQAEDRLRQTNERLARVNAELERATQLKDEFLASMSHELRTPLNSILGLSEALKTQVYGNLTQAQKRSLGTIERSGQHLLALINDILDLAKIESGKMELQIALTSVEQLCYSSLSFVKQQAHQKNIRLHCHIQEGIETIDADERRIRQVLINLLSNAVKFTPEGGRVSLEVEARTQEEMLGFSVIDTGIGIAPENFSLLFQSFVQLDSSLSRRYSGTGLGLALVRRLAELHGGTVTVESEVGVGSKFTVFLPWKAKNARPQTERSPDKPEVPLAIAPPSQLEPPLILVADDNDDNIETLWEYLHARGYRLIRAHNGLEIISLVQEKKPQAILMDVQMPEMDGLEAARRLKANPDTHKIPIIIVTALAMSGDREKGLAAGADEYVTKPMSLKKLCDSIDELLNNER
jgi:PAS domain S-box-containing protein